MNKALVYEKVFAEAPSSMSITLTEWRKKCSRYICRSYASDAVLSGFKELVAKTAFTSSTLET